MDGFIISTNFSLIPYHEGTASDRSKEDPMVLAQSYTMYKIGKLICKFLNFTETVKETTNANPVMQIVIPQNVHRSARTSYGIGKGNDQFLCLRSWFAATSTFLCKTRATTCISLVHYDI